jgi:hypothetical protein
MSCSVQARTIAAAIKSYKLRSSQLGWIVGNVLISGAVKDE